MASDWLQYVIQVHTHSDGDILSVEAHAIREIERNKRKKGGVSGFTGEETISYYMVYLSVRLQYILFCWTMQQKGFQKLLRAISQTDRMRNLQSAEIASRKTS